MCGSGAVVGSWSLLFTAIVAVVRQKLHLSTCSNLRKRLLRRSARLKMIAECFVDFNGKPVASIKKCFKSAVGLARLSGKVTPHTLRHTTATWLMQRGVPVWEAADFLGMSAEVLLSTYRHQSRLSARRSKCHDIQAPRFGDWIGG